MAKSLGKLIEKWWVVWVLLLTGGIFIYGAREMFFHQDDLDWFMMANRPFWAVMAAPLSDHINYIFRLLLKSEWDIFHLNFVPYLAVSVGLHLIVVWLLYKLVYATSGRRDLPAIAAIIFTLNTNWTEVVLWTSGQTISITVVFTLMAMMMIWKKRWVAQSIWLSSLTSALALGLVPATFLVYGVDYAQRRIRKMGWMMGLIAIFVLFVYAWRATDGTEIAVSFKWAIQVGEVMILAVVNTVVGRLIIPFDRWETLRIVGVCLLIVGGLSRCRGKLGAIWRDEWSRFLLLQLFFYYLVVAVGRAQYGVGIMRAERYGYLGLALVLLLLSRILRKWELGRWIWVVPMIVVIQGVGLYTRARQYVIRPQQMKELFSQVKKMDPKQIDPEAYLPHFVLNDERLKYGDLMNLMQN